MRSNATADRVAHDARSAPHMHSRASRCRLRARADTCHTGHTIASINEVLDRYTTLTADQAGTALATRLAHEGQAQESTVSAFVRR